MKKNVSQMKTCQSLIRRIIILSPESVHHTQNASSILTEKCIYLPRSNKKIFRANSRIKSELEDAIPSLE